MYDATSHGHDARGIMIEVLLDPPPAAQLADEKIIPRTLPLDSVEFTLPKTTFVNSVSKYSVHWTILPLDMRKNDA